MLLDAVRRPSLAIAAFAFVAFFALPIAAAEGPDLDRVDGEEEQIRKREHWFRDLRGLDVVEDAGAKRAAAAVAELEQRARAVTSTSPWEAVGPNSMTMLGWVMGNVAGRISAIAVHPTDDNQLYVGAAAGGVWKTTNGGTSWTPVFDRVGTQSIGSVLFDPEDPSRVYAGTGEMLGSCGYFGMGLFSSTDGGQSWQARNGSGAQTLDLGFVSALAIFRDDQNRRVLLAGGKADCAASGAQTSGGLFRSYDDGATWTRVATGIVWDIAVGRTGNPKPVFLSANLAAAVSGVYRSTDGGTVFLPLNGVSPAPFAAFGRVHLTQMAVDGSLYAFLPEQSGGSIYRTVNGGANWNLASAGACEGQCWYNAVVAVRPDVGSTVVIGTIRIAKSTASGASPATLTNFWGSSQQVHQDTHALAYSPSTPGRFWVGSDGGLWRTDNDGGTFSNRNGNLAITQFYDIAVHPTTISTLFGGAQDNSSQRRSTTSVWDVSLASGDGFMNVVDANNPSVVFQTSYPSGGLPWIAKSTAGGTPNSFGWMAQNGLVSGEPFQWVTPLAGAQAGGAGYLFVGSHSVYRANTNQSPGTFTWTKMSPQISTGSLQTLATATCAGQIRLFALAQNGRVQRNDDGLAATWVDVDDVPSSVVTDLAVSGNGCGSHVYVTAGTFQNPRLYRSTTSGNGWQPVGAGLPQVPANTVAVDPLNDDVYVGTDLGVYRSTDQGATFTPFDNNLPLGVPVTDLELTTNPHYLHAGTYGRGAFRVDLSSATLFFDGFETGNTAPWSNGQP
jgi:hypothetical protein